MMLGNEDATSDTWYVLDSMRRYDCSSPESNLIQRVSFWTIRCHDQKYRELKREERKRKEKLAGQTVKFDVRSYDNNLVFYFSFIVPLSNH